MPRGYRCIVFAVVGLALISTAPSGGKGQYRHQDASSGQITKELNRIETAIKESKPAEKADPGCPQGQDNRSSDLCAQWKAADAAGQGAWWGAATFWLGIAGAIIGALTLGAAGYAAWYAKEAADSAKKAISLEYRPWVVVSAKAINIAQFTPQGFAIDFEVSIRNAGNGIARNIFLNFERENVAGAQIGWEERFFDRSLESSSGATASGLLLQPEEEMTFRTVFSFDSTLVNRGGNINGIRPFIPAFSFCVDYRSLIDDEWHQAGKTLSFNGTGLAVHGSYDPTEFALHALFAGRAT